MLPTDELDETAVLARDDEDEEARDWLEAELRRRWSDDLEDDGN